MRLQRLWIISLIFFSFCTLKKYPLFFFKLNLLCSMTSLHSRAPRFSRSLPITCTGLLFSFFLFLFPAALLHESGRQILWQLQCFHLTPDGAASVYFTDQLLAKTTSSGSTQSAASPLGSLARSLRFMSSEKHFFVAFFLLLFCCLRLTQFLKAVSFFLAAKCFSMKSLYLSSDDNVSLHIGS